MRIGLFCLETMGRGLLLLQVFCFAYMFDSICQLNNNMLFVKGWSGMFLKLEIIKKVIVTPFFLLAIPYGPLVICYVAVLHTLVDITCSTYCLKKYLGIELRQYASVAKYFLLSLLACAPAFYVSPSQFHPGSRSLRASPPPRCYIGPCCTATRT